MFYVLYSIMTYLLTLPRSYILNALVGVRVFATFKPFDVYSDTEKGFKLRCIC
jgi:hypothetical protein